MNTKKREGIIVVMPPGKSASVSVFHQDPSHENWEKLLEENEHLKLDGLDINIWDLVLSVGVNYITQEVTDKVSNEYKKKNPSKMELIKTLLGKHKGQMLYYKKWEF